MVKRILVSLVSAQTIPNVELIKEFGDENTNYLFITTAQMQTQLEWIVKTTKISSHESIQVNAFDQDNIVAQLDNYNFGSGEIILNITGGTKLMSLVINEYFKNLGATIYYLTGHSKTYVKLFPNRGEQRFKLSKKLSLDEYLQANGFDIIKSELSFDYSISETFLKYFTTEDNYIESKSILRKLQGLRGLNKNKKIIVDDIVGLSGLLNRLNYKSEKKELTKYDARYITGDWFEEYIYYRVKNDLKLDDDEIGIGYKLTKSGVQNEIDVLFVYNHQLYLIECKTSFYDYRLQKDSSEKKINLMGEIIYKSDALQSKFGLLARTYILTLGEMRDDKGNVLQNFKPHIDRAELSKIKIISRKEVLGNLKMKELLKIN